jgi:tetratricopeptide (TPR) repeat protein
MCESLEKQAKASLEKQVMATAWDIFASPPAPLKNVKLGAANASDLDAVFVKMDSGVRNSTQGLLKDAEKDFRDAILLDKNKVLASSRICLAAVLQKNASFEQNEKLVSEAVDLLYTAVDMDPLIAEAYIMLSTLMRMRAQLSVAKQYLSMALKIHPKNPEWLMYLGSLELEMGSLEQDMDKNVSAKAAFKEAIAIGADNAAAWVGVGVAHFRLGEFIDACSALKKAASLGSDFDFGIAMTDDTDKTYMARRPLLPPRLLF